MVIRKDFQKLKIALEYLLLWKDYMRALSALEFAKSLHNGYRKDWVTPEFQHQVEICLYILTLKWITNEEDYICTALLHDTREDYDITHEEIENRFGANVANAVELLTKKYRWKIKKYDEYFEALSKNKYASIVKWADRINNLSSMVWVFTKEKQLSYVNEVEKYFLPMLKGARRNFPELTFAFFNIETMLREQINPFSESKDIDQ